MFLCISVLNNYVWFLPSNVEKFLLLRLNRKITFYWSWSHVYLSVPVHIVNEDWLEASSCFVKCDEFSLCLVIYFTYKVHFAKLCKHISVGFPLLFFSEVVFLDLKYFIICIFYKYFSCNKEMLRWNNLSNISNIF